MTPLSVDVEATLRELGRRGYHIIRQIGKGSFGYVYLARKDQQKIAIKICYKRFPGEWHYWMHFNHPHLLKLLERYKIGAHCVYVMERAKYGSIHHWLHLPLYKKAIATSSFHVKHFNKWIWQVLDSVSYLHYRGYYHLDIKTDNIFLDINLDVKLGDFGLLCRNGQTNFVIGAPSYWPPELQHQRTSRRLIHAAGPWLEKVDSFFVGTAFLYLSAGITTGQSLMDMTFNSEHIEEKIDDMYTKIELNLKKIRNYKLRLLVEKLLERDVPNRMTCRLALEITRSDFMKRPKWIYRHCSCCSHQSLQSLHTILSSEYSTGPESVLETTWTPGGIRWGARASVGQYQPQLPPILQSSSQEEECNVQFQNDEREIKRLIRQHDQSDSEQSYDTPVIM